MIVSFSPFLAVENSSLDNSVHRYKFDCPYCHSNSCVHLDDIDVYNFWSGEFKCSSCGKSSYNYIPFCYYNDCFKEIKISKHIQLTFDF